MEFSHTPIMLNECMEYLIQRKDGVYVDCTLGGGGHSFELLKRTSPDAKLIAFDKDIDAITAAKEKLKDFSDRVTYINDDFKNAPRILKEKGIDFIDGVLADLGCSSFQFDCPQRGFSYRYDAPLDMRMDKNQNISAYDIVNNYDQEKLAQILFDYGEEKFARRIAKNIVESRESHPIKTTFELIEILKKSIPTFYNQKGGHPAKRTFQALRIEVNKELDGLYDWVIEMGRMLNKGARMCIITFHSLEDKIVKNAYFYLESDCVCDKSLPVCVCGKKREVFILTKKGLHASPEELQKNKRAQSANLRVLEKI